MFLLSGKRRSSQPRSCNFKVVRSSCHKLSSSQVPQLLYALALLTKKTKEWFTEEIAQRGEGDGAGGFKKRFRALQTRSDLCIHRHETARPRSPCPLSCICEKFPRIGPPILLQQIMRTDRMEI
jgi:hypothetical protein